MPRPDEVVSIAGQSVGLYPESDDTSPWFTLGLAAGDPAMHCSAVADRHLTLRDVIAQHYDVGVEEYWRARWRPIIREGKYLPR